MMRKMEREENRGKTRKGYTKEEAKSKIMII